MLAAAALVAYAVLAASLGPLTLRGSWTHRSPAAALRCWQALCASVLLAGTLVPLTLAVPYLPVDHVLAHALRAEPLAVADHYRGPLGLWPVLVAHLLLVSALVAVATSAARQALATSRTRRRQHRSLALVGERQPEGHWLVPHAEPAVWCVPGRRSAVVVTTGAQALLHPEELAAALLHERGHLRAHHGAAVAVARVLARALPGVRLLRRAEAATTVLVELAADDAARRPAQRAALRRALVLLGTGVRPAGTLAASGTATLQRVQRLGGEDSGPRWRRGLALVAAGLVLLAPVLVALAPGLEAAVHHCLPDEPLWLAR